MTAIDEAYRRTQRGDSDGFAAWVRCVEPALRKSLRGFARHVDVEAMVQEGLLRMWVLAPTLALEGDDASLRYALRLVRNLALREAERMDRFVPLPPAEEASAAVVDPDPPSDPGLRRTILDCLGRLPAGPRAALRGRLSSAGRLADRELALGLRMTLNTFLQNVVRARIHLADCLRSRGVAVERFLA